MKRPIGLCLTLAVLAAGCGKEPPPRPRTAQQERAFDSTLGASGLPGAAGVRGALRAVDSAAARRAREDSIANHQ